MSEIIIKMRTLSKKADNDLESAEGLLIGEKNSYADNICFLSQQSIEKNLKAYLLSCEADFPHTHNLDLLLSLCSKFDTEFKNFDLGGFANYGVIGRYEDIAVTLNEAKKAFEIAKQVSEFVKSRI